jgi:hypothetical protein
MILSLSETCELQIDCGKEDGGSPRHETIQACTVSFLFVLCRDPSVLLRMPGGVWAGGEKPPVTRLDYPLFVMRPHADNFNCLDIV